MQMQLLLDDHRRRTTILLAQLHDMDNEQQEQRQRARSVWVRQWILRRSQLGQYEQLLQELRDEDRKGFKNFLRMDHAMFQELLQRVQGRLTKQDTNYRKALEPSMKLAITLRYMASGESYHSLMYGFRVAHNTISKFVPEVCAAIVAELAVEVMKVPQNAEDWREIADYFSQRWNFHHCVGAIDGKHVAIRKPKHGGSLYFNYKGFHSIILMALVDGDYKFRWAEVGTNGAASDAQIFNDCELHDMHDDGQLPFPAPEPLPHDDRDMPYFYVADDAFALQKWLMKPHSLRGLTRGQRIFNYRLSRARRVVENAFGILAQRFQCMLTTMRQSTQNVEKIVMACMCLHNFLRMRNPGIQNGMLDQEDEDHNYVPGAWREGTELLGDGHHRGGARATTPAKLQRDYLTAYYNSPVGAVEWQDQMI